MRLWLEVRRDRGGTLFNEKIHRLTSRFMLLSYLIFVYVSKCIGYSSLD